MRYHSSAAAIIAESTPVSIRRSGVRPAIEQDLIKVPGTSRLPAAQPVRWDTLKPRSTWPKKVISAQASVRECHLTVRLVLQPEEQVNMARR